MYVADFFTSNTISVAHLNADIEHELGGVEGRLPGAIGSRCDGRGSDRDRVVFAGSIEGTEVLGSFKVYRRLWRAHLGFCRRVRYPPNLCRDCFVYCGERELKTEDEVMAVKVMMPDEFALDVKESDLPDLERGQMEIVKCQASEAHAQTAFLSRVDADLRIGN